MASPQRRDPNQLRDVPPPPLENLPAVERQVGTGGVFNWWWLWIPVVIAAFWFVGWGWGPYGGWWWGHGAESQTGSAQSSAPSAPNTNASPANGALAGGMGAGSTSNGGSEANAGSGNARATAMSAAPAATIAGTGVAILDATHKQQFVGHHFQITNIPVQKQASEHALWIGAANTNHSWPMLVVLPAGDRTKANVGDRLDVTGTVEKAPTSSRAQHEWGIGGDDATQLEKDGAYIQATQLYPAHP